MKTTVLYKILCCVTGFLLTYNFSSAQHIPKRVFTEVDIMPEYAGGAEGLSNYIKSNTRPTDEAIKQDIEGTVYIQIIVDSVGNIHDPKILKGIGAGCDEEAIRIVSKMGKWAPGLKNGGRVNVYVTIPFEFRVSKQENLDNGLQVQVMLYPDIVGRYAEGDLNMMKIISQNLVYPDSAKENNIEGRVVLQFIIDPQGNISNIKAIKSPDVLLSKEAGRLMPLLGKWTPGYKNGIPVYTYSRLHIDFRLQ